MEIGPPSVLFGPCAPILIADGNTDQYKRGLSTHVCRTLALMRKTVLLPQLPFTLAVCSLCVEIRPYAQKLHAPIAIAQVQPHMFCQKHSANLGWQSIIAGWRQKLVTDHICCHQKCSSKRLPLRSPCCFSGWLFSNQCSMRPSLCPYLPETSRFHFHFRPSESETTVL